MTLYDDDAHCDCRMHTFYYPCIPYAVILNSDSDSEPAYLFSIDMPLLLLLMPTDDVINNATSQLPDTDDDDTDDDDDDSTEGSADRLLVF